MTRNASAAALAPESTWQAMLASIKTKINPHSYETWFAPTRQQGTENGTMHVSVPSSLFQRRLSQTYAATLQEALNELGKPELRIEFIFPKPFDPPPALPVKKPNDEFPVPQLSETAWYGLSKEYRALVSPRTEASVNYHLAGFLAAVGSCLGRRVYIEKGGRLHANLFLVVVGRSGGGRVVPPYAISSARHDLGQGIEPRT